jgi:hypothetical protein
VNQEQNLQRIREIKSLVNDRVGNPVNLVDIDNEVGREYMSALLDAMKKLNSGSSAVAAMQRLELSYASVDKTLENQSSEAVEKITEPTPSVKPVTQAAQVPAATEPIPAVAQTEDAPSTDKELKITEAVPAATPAPVSTPVHVTSNSTPIPKPQPAAPKAVSAAETDVDSLPIDTQASAWGPATDTLKSDSQETKKPKTFTSLADSKTKPKTPADLPEASSIETSSVSGDPLFTKEVDDGLQQLLSDWGLFKKSGLFGTGPKGREHPLFKKIAALQIPLLLAGRFEGATQEIKQSITDYMNGWRYEQGIVYLQGETFEHYLRRVIRHIIDLQKKS